MKYSFLLDLNDGNEITDVTITAPNEEAAVKQFISKFKDDITFDTEANIKNVKSLDELAAICNYEEDYMPLLAYAVEGAITDLDLEYGFGYRSYIFDNGIDISNLSDAAKEFWDLEDDEDDEDEPWYPDAESLESSDVNSVRKEILKLKNGRECLDFYDDIKAELKKSGVNVTERIIGYPEYGVIGLSLINAANNNWICSIKGLFFPDETQNKATVDFNKLPYTYDIYAYDPKVTVEKIVADVLNTL